MKRDIMFCQFPFGNSTVPDVGDWLVETVKKAARDPRVGEIFHNRVDDTPITMGRNRAIEAAKAVGADILIMVDSDMNPDAYLSTNPLRLATDQLAKPFWDFAFDFMVQQPEPCCIAAPYCGPPPRECCYVFKWCNWQNDHPNPDFRLEMFSREEAAVKYGMEEVGALPTGLIMIDMRGIERIEPPYFRYEYTDKFETNKASTEDVVFTRDLNLQGVKQYCAWSCWAGHWKRKCVGKPLLTTIDQVSEHYQKAVKRNTRMGERMISCKNGFAIPELAGAE